MTQKATDLADASAAADRNLTYQIDYYEATPALSSQKIVNDAQNVFLTTGEIRSARRQISFYAGRKKET